MSTLLPNISTTRQNIVSAAKRLIRTRSYQGFSFQDIADEVGLRKASVHHHFPSKESLGVAVMQDSIQVFEAWSASTPDAADAKLDAFFEMYRNGLHAGKGLCSAGTFAAGWDCITEELRDAVRDMRTLQISWLTGVLDTLEQDEQGHSVNGLAAFVFATCQGAMVSARMTEQVADFDEAVINLKRLLGVR